MGKFMKKGKITGDLALMEVPQSALGVRTRARTLALQQNPDFCYLQLRSRRLEKPQFPPPSPEKSKPGNRNSAGHRTASFSRSKKVELGENEGNPNSGTATPLKRGIGAETDDLGTEASFGENNLEFDGTGRGTRESTPCSLLRGLDSIGTPGSAVRSTCARSANQRRPQSSSAHRSVPSTHEVEDFFATAEMQQQKQFMEKYNFDIVNDSPLPGRYEWVRVDP